MSRHRNVRNLSLDSFGDDYDYDDYDDDDAENSEYYYKRDGSANLPATPVPSLADSEEDMMYQSSLEYMKSTLGDSFTEAAMINALAQSDYSAEIAIKFLLEGPPSLSVPTLTKKTSPSVVKLSPKPIPESKTPLKSPKISAPSAPPIVVSKQKEREEIEATNQITQDMTGLGLEVNRVLNIRSANSNRSSPKVEKKRVLLDVTAEYEKRKREEKERLALIVVEAQKIGKGSFAFAWLLDETGEERRRGITMDIAESYFETPNKRIILLDAPGHRDFIPNMITGAAQADVAVLVVNANTNEFEAGFEMGGQTREHALLIRSLGVTQLIIAVNKLDMVEWSQDRFNTICNKLGPFLKIAGYKEKSLVYVPCSGLSGQNLTNNTEPLLSAWYSGPTLIGAIDALQPPIRTLEQALRLSISDVFKSLNTGMSLAGPIICGHLQPGSSVMLMPGAEMGIVKAVEVNDAPAKFAVAGDHVTLSVTGLDMTHVNTGMLLCDPEYPIKCVSRIQAQIVVFNVDVPITKGCQTIVHYQMLNQPAVISKLEILLDKTTGEIAKKKPRVLPRNSTGIVEVTFNRPICMEEYKEFRDLGRFMMRDKGQTIAAGIVMK
eukprot:Ihof_evm1s512 gene=Ihof_evmTU1s512